MFSCNEKTKKSEYIDVYLYLYKSIYERQTDRRPGLLKGEWGQGSPNTGPSPSGDSPAVILCLGEPSTSSILILFSTPSPSTQVVNPWKHTPLPPDPALLLWPGLKASISTLTMPKHLNEQRGHVNRRPPK